ncbi:MAG: hypothetical protein WC340_17655 [Kiritimatiellia bacterium]
MAEQAEAKIIIDGDSGNAEVAMDKTSEAAEKMDSAVGNKLENIGKKMTSTGTEMTKWVTGPLAGIGAAVGAMVNSTAKYADEIDKTSMRVGATKEGLQELNYAFGQVGVDAASAEKALGVLNQRMGEISSGSAPDELVAAFDSLDLSVTNADGSARAMNDVMMDMIGALGQVEDPAKRASMAGELLGTKLGRELMPVFDAGADGISELTARANELGLVMKGETVSGFVEFGDKVDDAKQQLGAATRDIATAFLPILLDAVIPAVLSFTGGIKSVTEFLGNMDPTLMKVVVSIAALVAGIGPTLLIVGSLIGKVKEAVEVFGMIQKSMGLVTTFMQSSLLPLIIANGPIILAIGAVIAAGVLLYKNWDTVMAWAQKLWDGLRGAFYQIKDYILAVIESLKKCFAGFVDTVKGVIDTVTGVISKVKDTVSGIFSWITGAAKKTGEEATKAVADGLQKHSPSAIERMFMDIDSTARQSFDNIISNARVLSGNLRTVSNGMQFAPQIAVAGGGSMSGRYGGSAVAGGESMTVSGNTLHLHFEKAEDADTIDKVSAKIRQQWGQDARNVRTASGRRRF